MRNGGPLKRGPVVRTRAEEKRRTGRFLDLFGSIGMAFIYCIDHFLSLAFDGDLDLRIQSKQTLFNPQYTCFLKIYRSVM